MWMVQSVSTYPGHPLGHPLWSLLRLQSHYDQQLQEAAVSKAADAVSTVAAGAAEAAPARGDVAKRGTIFEARRSVMADLGWLKDGSVVVENG